MDNEKMWRIIGLTVVGIAYIGGLIGWTWAVRSLPEPSPPPDSTQTAPPSSALPDVSGKPEPVLVVRLSNSS